MSSELLEPLELNIDLTFRCLSDIGIGSFVDAPTENCRIRDSKFWSDQLTLWIDYIRKDINAICPDLVRQIDSFSIGLELTDDFKITKLNKKWLNKETKTDVLSFPVFDEKLVEPGNNHAELGDIIVSLQTAQQQALDQKHKLSLELRWLVSHGLLHLLGWDHLNSKTLKDMLSFQEQLLKISVSLQNEEI